MSTRWIGLVVACLTPAVFAQSSLETGVMTGHTTGSAVNAGTISGKGISKILGKTRDVLKQAEGDITTPSPVTTARPATPQSRPAPVSLAAAPAKAPEPESTPALPPPTSPEDLPNGMTRQDMISRFGKPAFSFSMPDGPALVETARYRSPEGELVVTLRDGKVAEVKRVTAP